MLFSDLNKIIVNANIIGKLPKKKIKFISDHSSNITANTLFVINKKRNFKLSYLQEAISKNLNTIITNHRIENFSVNQIIVKDLDKEVLKLVKLRLQTNRREIIAHLIRTATHMVCALAQSPLP